MNAPFRPGGNPPIGRIYSPRRQSKATHGSLSARQLARVRREAEATIERLIAFLDQVEGDADLEPAGDEQDEDRDEEPSLGWPDSGPNALAPDVPFFVGAELDAADEEPSLAAFERHPGPCASGGQAGWASGNSRDLEGDAKEDDEPGGDDEPSLGWDNVTTGRVMVEGSPLWPPQRRVIDPGFDQSDASWSGDSDLEAEFDGREPDVDDEDGHDAEDDHAEKFGIADHHALDDPGMNLSLAGKWRGDGIAIADRMLDQAGIERRPLRPLTGRAETRSW